MREKDTSARVDDEGPVAPSRCPACRSGDITTTSKVVTAQSYWRCVACGEVWNASRHRAGGVGWSGNYRRGA